MHNTPPSRATAQVDAALGMGVASKVHQKVGVRGAELLRMEDGGFFRFSPVMGMQAPSSLKVPVTAFFFTKTQPLDLKSSLT